MTPGSSKAGKVDLKNKPQKGVAFNSICVAGSSASLTIDKKNFVLSEQMILGMQAVLWGVSAEISIPKIVVKWCPNVEPGTLSSVVVRLAYYLGDEVDDINADETVVSAVGKISEGLLITVYPTKTIIKPADMAFFCPWTASVEIGDNIGDDKPVLGNLQMWCQVKIKMFAAHCRPRLLHYRVPSVQWNNTYYPYYVPLYLIKTARGICPIMWRDTPQYKDFQKDIVPHLDRSPSKDREHLTIMQTMSTDDLNKLRTLVKDCHVAEGGFCTCGDRVICHVKEILSNNNNRCADISGVFDSISSSVKEGKLKSVKSHPMDIF